ncbi:LysM peptidoglycan-binding domain-containing protein [Leucothrix arctica]|uniref:LysM domain-containing protein n=1 Tax=Leucothrix arctica TaxID=1481894 RepID=A0A317CCH0_9GAMM|nr:hypothetical protein [Leucothrix arctica]PWQ96324.1 hypothetical protein DKT75_10085 [Leucothrix arctica]
MSNNALIKLLNIVLVSSVCLTPVMSKPVDPSHIQQLTQTVAVGVLTKLNMLDKSKPELLSMSLEKVVSEALHAGKPIEEIREAVSLTMEEITGKPFTPPVVTRTVPLTTVLLPNESLSSVAKRIYGPENGRRYLDIYEYNKDVIKDINVIPEGTVLKLPE